jgi:hypothetical protein
MIMKTMSATRKFLTVAFATAALPAGLAPAAAQEAVIAGVWRAQEGTPSGFAPGPTASDVQTLYLSPDGHYRREIIVEGGDGQADAAGKIIDTGEYRFTLPNVLQYRRQSWTVCTYLACTPGQPTGPNAGTLPFERIGERQAVFLQLNWTKVR